MMPVSTTPHPRLTVDITRLQRIFDRRAPFFDQAAFLPREIAQRMRERLDYIACTPVRTLDAGCGLGDDLRALQARFPETALYGSDISRGMLEYAARQQLRNTKPWFVNLFKSATTRVQRQQLVQANFATLPFATGAFDLLWSNFALHWHPQIDCVLTEWHRILNADGLCLFSTLGPDSLRELRASWLTVEAGVSSGQVIDFVDMHDLGDLLVAAGFAFPVMDMETITLTYPSSTALLNDVRCWGAYPFKIPTRPSGLMGRDKKAALQAALDQQRRADGTIALTIEVIYGHAWKKSKKKPTDQHIVHVQKRKSFSL
jgi:malonyl-CoA O-methyltransferase